MKKGGFWINYGPLLYHFDGHPSEVSVELPLDEIIRIAKLIGFIIEEKGTDFGVHFSKSLYCQLPWSMMKTEYEGVFFLAAKK